MNGHLLRYRKDVTYCFLDLETFNLCLSFIQNRPWQIGVLKVKGESIVDGLDIRVNWPDAPHLSIGKEAAIITRYNPQQHAKLAINPQPAFEKFWPILEEADYIIMHNGLKFDLYLLKDYAEMMGRPWKWMMPKIIDTKAIAQGYKMGIQFKPAEDNFLQYQYRMANIIVKGVKTNLTALGKEFGIEHDYENLHDALCDLELNLKIWNKLKFHIEL